MKTVYPGIKQAILLCLTLILLQILAGIILNILQSINGLESVFENKIIKQVLNVIVTVMPTIIVIFWGFKRTKLRFNEEFWAYITAILGRKAAKILSQSTTL